MTDKNNLFIFDVKTLKILGSFVFAGTFKGIHRYPTRIVVDVDNYFPTQLVKGLEPIPREGGFEVRVSDIKKRNPGVEFYSDVIPFNFYTKLSMEEAARQIVAGLKERVKEEEDPDQKKESAVQTDQKKETPVHFGFMITLGPNPKKIYS
jgi:hypothetical protein